MRVPFARSRDRPTAPNTGNAKMDKKNQQQLDKQYAQQQKERQKVQKQQEKEDQKVAKQNNDAQKTTGRAAAPTTDTGNAAEAPATDTGNAAENADAGGEARGRRTSSLSCSVRDCSSIRELL